LHSMLGKSDPEDPNQMSLAAVEHTTVQVSVNPVTRQLCTSNFKICAYRILDESSTTGKSSANPLQSPYRAVPHP
jgi:hypothetical protein